MHTFTAYTIFWTPNNTISVNYQTLINRYFADVGGSAFLDIQTQYFESPGPTYIQNNSTVGGTWVDTTSAYPGGRGSDANPLMDQDLRDEVLRAHREHHFGNCPLGVFAGQVDRDPVLREELAALFDQWQQAIGELLRRAADQGRARPDVDPADASLALLSALQGGTLLSHLHGGPGPLTRALDGAIAHLT